ncbi:MAG: hypothetical protein WAW96_07670, partial [Alphaproteobacteria bacterium]
LNPANNGILVIPTQLEHGIEGPSSKWVQVLISGIAEAPLKDCEAWLVGLERLDADGRQTELEPEHIHCTWSMRQRERTITIPALIKHHANLFVVYESRPGALVPQLEPPHITLTKEVQKPGRYRASIVVTASNAPSVQASFIIDWKSFSEIAIKQE